MGFSSVENLWEEIAKEICKGEMKIGDINLVWDFTELFEEAKAKQEMNRRQDFMVTKDGFIMMYNLGII